MLKFALILVIGVIAVVLYLILRRSVNCDVVDTPDAQEKCKEKNDEMTEHSQDTAPSVPPEPKERSEESLESTLEDHQEISDEHEAGAGEQFHIQDDDEEGEIDLKEYFENELDKQEDFQED